MTFWPIMPHHGRRSGMPGTRHPSAGIMTPEPNVPGGNMRIRHTIAIAAAALALAACTPTEDTGSSKSDPKPASSKPADPKKLDDAGKQACDDFAHGYNDGANTSDERLDLAHKVNKSARSSKTNRIADSGHVLANGAAGSANAWQLAADTFAQACLDGGWKA